MPPAGFEVTPLRPLVGSAVSFLEALEPRVVVVVSAVCEVEVVDAGATLLAGVDVVDEAAAPGSVEEVDVVADVAFLAPPPHAARTNAATTAPVVHQRPVRDRSPPFTLHPPMMQRRLHTLSFNSL
jgi:hypothetical protein